jgi:hypothetical protein
MRNHRLLQICTIGWYDFVASTIHRQAEQHLQDLEMPSVESHIASRKQKTKSNRSNDLAHFRLFPKNERLPMVPFAADADSAGNPRTTQIALHAGECH